MVNVIIDKQKISVREGTTILDAAEAAGVHIPTLCYLKELNEIGACRICVVEVEGQERLVTACNNEAAEGMVIYTNSPKVRIARRTNVEMILSEHDCTCATCVRGGNCALQTVANDLGIIKPAYNKKLPNSPWPSDFPLIRDANKCINCMRCIQVCDLVQSVHVWDLVGTGSRTTVGVSGNRKIENSGCVLCGQCITQCPVGALYARNDIDKVFDALADPKKITVIQIAPAVRVAWGESLGISREFATVHRLVAALRRMGFNYIFDTSFSADLTIMEEGSEFIERMSHKDEHKFPMFTSCCPGWIRFVKSQYPELVDQLSTAKSPQQMFGAIAKSYYADLLGVSPEDIFCVSAMPCTAKKHECNIPGIDSAGAGKDVDVVLTTREINRMIRAEHIIASELPEEDFDSPLGIGTGAGLIFGATGGVMEAALRSAYYLVTKKNPDPDTFKAVRGMGGWKEADFEMNGELLKVAVASGLANSRKLIEAIKSGDVSYDFVEIMACPGGCSGGGGQPIHLSQEMDMDELRAERAEGLYGLDKINTLRFSHENPAVLKCYENYLQRPLSHRSHELLHFDNRTWQMPK